MPDDAQETVTTPCPRCGRPIAWAVYTRGGVEALEVADQPCPCQLARDEWADLAEQAEAALEGRDG